MGLVPISVNNKLTVTFKSTLSPSTKQILNDNTRTERVARVADQVGLQPLLKLVISMEFWMDSICPNFYRFKASRPTDVVASY